MVIVGDGFGGLNTAQNPLGTGRFVTATTDSLTPGATGPVDGGCQFLRELSATSAVTLGSHFQNS